MYRTLLGKEIIDQHIEIQQPKTCTKMCTDPGCESAVEETHCSVTASYGQLHEINSFNCCSIPHSPFS